MCGGNEVEDSGEGKDTENAKYGKFCQILKDFYVYLSGSINFVLLNLDLCISHLYPRPPPPPQPTGTAVE